MLYESLNYLKSFLLKLKDPLHKNAAYLMMNTIGTSALGFMFWMIVAKFYSPTDVGYATAIISSMTLLAELSTLGFGIGFIRFLPSTKGRESNDMINSCFTMSGMVSILFAGIFLLGLDLWSPALNFIRKNAFFILLFILFTFVWVITILLKNVFISHRSANYVFVKDSGIFSGLKVILPLFLLHFGVLGIFSAWGIGAIIAVACAFIFLLPKIQPGYMPNLLVKRNVISPMLCFSFGNHIGEVFKMLPRLLLPLMIVNLLSAPNASYFYISWMIANLLFMIPMAISISLFAEGSIEEKMFKKNIKKAIKFILVILIPTIFIIYLFADKILWFVGSEYSKNATLLLQILALSSIPFAINTLYVAIKRVEKKVKEVIGVYGMIALGTLSIGYLLLNYLGLVGIGVGWLATQAILCSSVMGFWVWKKAIRIVKCLYVTPET